LFASQTATNLQSIRPEDYDNDLMKKIGKCNRVAGKGANAMMKKKNHLRPCRAAVAVWAAVDRCTTARAERGGYKDMLGGLMAVLRAMRGV